MKTALILTAMLLVGCAACGCRGGLFGGRQSPDQGNGDIKVYEIHIAPNARSIVNVGNAGQNVPMYQAPNEGGTTPAEGNGATRVTTPAMPASATGGNAGTAAGENVILVVNDGVKRTAESDIAAAAQLMAGNTGTQGTQTPAQVQRQGTANPTSTSTATPSVTETTSTPIALTGQGTAAPASQAAGPASTPTQTVAPPPAASQEALQAQYDQALVIAKALGTGGAAAGANTDAQAAAQARLLETERALNAAK